MRHNEQNNKPHRPTANGPKLRCSLRRELMPIFVLPLASYILAVSLSYDNDLDMNAVSISLLVMVLTLIWFISLRIMDLQSEILQRRVAEDLIRKSEERFRILVEKSSDGIAIVNAEGDISYTGVSNAEMLGYQPEDQMGQNIFDTIHPEDKARLAEKFADLVKGPNSTINTTYRALHKDGSWRTTEIVARNLAENPNVNGVIVNFRDITDRQQAEDALRESEQKYREVVERANDGICILKDGIIKYANPHAITILGYLPEEIIGTPMHNYIHPDELPKVVERYNRRMAGEEVESRYESVLLHKEGANIDVEINAGLILYEGEKADLIIIHDVTERKKVERDIRNMNRQLEEAMDQLKASHEQLLQSEKLAAVGQLVSGVTHELNNPLMAISGYSQILLKGLEDEKYAKYAQNLNAEAQRAIGIVQDLLSFARKQKPEKILVSINESLESVIRLRSHDMSLDNIKVETELAPNLPKVMGDFQQLQQVFLNLILNAEQAIKEFRNNGNIVIQTKMVDQKIEIEISDDGPGIPQEFQGKIFEPFFTTKEVGKGTGLGLSICYGIIQEHEGIILVESNEGKGVTFTVELPIVAEAIPSIS